MANILRTITLTVDPAAAGPLYDVYYSIDCTNYTICTDGSSVSLPTVGSTANVTFPDNTSCVKLINLSSGCGNNFVVESLAFTLDYLIVAGGGGGGLPGGGGAGGLLSGSFTIVPSDPYNIFVGGGGTGSLYSPARNSANGISSSIQGTALYTASIGGGRGGTEAVGSALVGGNGGSGGGSGFNTTTVATGTSGQGNNGGIYAESPQGAAGGGASQVGGNGVLGIGGAGAIWLDGLGYAGGGGAASIGGGVSGSASDGGGAGSINNSSSGTAGTVNTGGGGGGGGNSGNQNGGNGGYGVIKMRYPLAYNAVIGGGLTASTVTTGSYKITSFTSGSGTVSFFT